MLTDGLLNVETIKCFGAEEATGIRFERATSLTERRWATFQWERLRVGLIEAAVFTLSITTLLAVTVHAVLQGTLSAGGFVLANVYMLQVARPLAMLGTASRDLSQAVEFIRPLIEVLKQDGETPVACRRSPVACLTDAKRENAATPTEFVDEPGVGSLSLRDVGFAYAGGEHRAKRP